MAKIAVTNYVDVNNGDTLILNSGSRRFIAKLIDVGEVSYLVIDSSTGIVLSEYDNLDELAHAYGSLVIRVEKGGE